MKVPINETWASPLAAIKAAMKTPGYGGYRAEYLAAVVLDKFLDVTDTLEDNEFFETCQDVATDLGLILNRNMYPVGSVSMYRYHARPKDGE
jgi:hypothetical protein